MSSDDVKTLFQAHPVPSMRASLADDILDVAKQSPRPAANDNPGTRSQWMKGLAAIAATAIVGTFVWIQMEPLQPAEADQWEDLATSSGFSELYAWVHADSEDETDL